MSKRVKVSSEIEGLRRVIVHRPDEGIARVSPSQAEKLLFDDIVYLPQMQQEHAIFRSVLESFVGSDNVLETETLLQEAVEADPMLTERMLKLVVEDEELPKTVIDQLKALTPKELTYTLITGQMPDAGDVLFDPIPNFIFTRDIAVTINDYVLVTKAAKNARYRENFLTRFIIMAHPIFSEPRKEGKVINMNDVDQFPPSKKGESVSIEGGDVMILNKDYLCIGRSERTTAHAIGLLKDYLFERDVVDNVVQINIPAERSCMHIDTIFTMIDETHTVAYKPIVVDGHSSNVIVNNKDGSSTMYNSIADFMRGEINDSMEFILSGHGESPYQEREQWTDGCNLVAVRPGVALTYDRNPRTEDAFVANGFQVIHAHEYLNGVKNGIIDPKTIEKTIITLPSGELSRARGGSHCMTCPIERG